MSSIQHKGWGLHCKSEIERSTGPGLSLVGSEKKNYVCKERVMNCPKCNSNMKELKIETLHGPVVIDQCEGCKGLWFDIGEAEQLKGDWMADFLDSGDPEVGKTYNTVRDVECPRCGKPMQHVNDPKQKHLEYEACEEHGMFMDAGEFTDFKHETLLDIFRDLASRIKRRK